MKKSDKFKAWLHNFSNDIFIIHKKVLATIMLIIGVPLLWISLSWLLVNESESPLMAIEGKVTTYDFPSISSREPVEITIDPTKIEQDSLRNKFFYFKYIETFNRNRFDKMGGGIGALVKLKIDSSELKNYGLELHSLIFKDEEFMDGDLRKKLIRKNQWAGLAAAIIALSLAFGLFKLLGMIKSK